ncbi:MAG: amino acid permease [Gemmatimonadetes bacterium]|nr:amino acid permease [Gemmatimonadota bacterium]
MARTDRQSRARHHARTTNRDRLVPSFHVKPMSALLADSESAPLKRALGPLNLTTLGIGSIIGTGIFVLTGTAASQNAGPALVISMIIAAVGCVFAGLCYSELAAMIPVAGSAYTYAYATTGELFAWIIGWDLILEYALACSTIAVGWAGYATSLLRDLGLAIPPQLAAAPGVSLTLPDGTAVHGIVNLPAMVIVLLVAALLVFGIKKSANTNTALVLVKVLVLVLFVGAGAAYVTRANLTPFIPPNTGEFGHFGWSGVLRGAGVMFFAYIGFDAVSTAAQESRNPQRDLPVGILASLAICTVIFIAVAIVLIGIVPYQQLNVSDPLAVGIDATGLTWLRPLVKVGAVLGLFSTILVQMIGQTRIFYSMSRDGLLPELFGRVHPTYGTPHVSTILTGVVCALVAGLTPINVLSELVSMGTLLAFVLVCVGIVVLRRTNPDTPRPFRTPGLPWVAIIGALVCLAQMVALPGATWMRLVVWLVAGMVIYVGYARGRAARVRAVA